MNNIMESDWKLFRQLHKTALNRFCERILKDAGAIMSKSAMSRHECYLELYNHLKEKDKDVGCLFDDLRRSTALIQLKLICSHALLTREEMDQFSPEVQNWLIP
jgi:hypothetical protein